MSDQDSDSRAKVFSIEPAEPEVDQMKLQMFMQQVKDNQNLSLGIMYGAAAALAGAMVWAMITAFSGWQIGFMAIGVGFLVGFAIRKTGKGVSFSFGVAGAVLSLLGCLLGNLLAVCIQIAQLEGLPFMDVFNQLDLGVTVELMTETFNPMDVLFYGFALYYGYKTSFYELSEEEMATLVKR